MMKSSTLFVVGHRPPTSTSRPPDVIYVRSVPRPSPFFVLVYYFERKPKNKNGIGLGTRLAVRHLGLFLPT